MVAAGRIYELLPTHPAMLTIDAERAPYALFRIPELIIDDLGLEIMELRMALAHARIRWRSGHTP
jgi:hypothetical protein